MANELIEQVRNKEKEIYHTTDLVEVYNQRCGKLCTRYIRIICG